VADDDWALALDGCQGLGNASSPHHAWAGGEAGVVGNQVEINAVAVDLRHVVAVVDADASNQGANSSHCSMTNKLQHQVLRMREPKSNLQLCARAVVLCIHHLWGQWAAALS